MSKGLNSDLGPKYFQRLSTKVDAGKERFNHSFAGSDGHHHHRNRIFD